MLSQTPGFADLVPAVSLCLEVVEISLAFVMRVEKVKLEMKGVWRI